MGGDTLEICAYCGGTGVYWDCMCGSLTEFECYDRGCYSECPSCDGEGYYSG